MIKLFTQTGNSMTFLADLTQSQFEEVKAFVERQTGVRPASSRAKEVEVVAIDQTIFSKYLDGQDDKGRAAQPISQHQVFPSAAAASRHLGCTANVVALALSKVRSSRTKVATVRGVSWRFVSDRPFGDTYVDEVWYVEQMTHRAVNEAAERAAAKARKPYHAIANHVPT